MKRPLIFVGGLEVLMGGFEEKMKQKTEPTGVIGRSYEDGSPVIWSFVNESPSEAKRLQLPWLTVIAWEYDGGCCNGMPPPAENARMLKIEDTLEQHVEKAGFCERVYSRTGNNLKEFVYYIHDRETFTTALNEALREHPRYPISITFYEDQGWDEFNRLVKDFSKDDGEQFSGGNN